MEKSHEDINQRLLHIYELLNSYFGDLHWWSGESPFEIIVGAILTQNTNWKNVEKAIDTLKSKGSLSPEKILMSDDPTLADMIKSSGYHNVKARRLKAFVRYLHEEFSGSLDRLFSEDLGALRKILLAIKGIGEETADSILLYAGNKPIFVVDAYTRRILERHAIIHAGEKYSNIQNLFMSHLPQSVSLYNQFHALLVNTGKYFCKKTPQCMGCPLKILT